MADVSPHGGTQQRVKKGYKMKSTNELVKEHNGVKVMLKIMQGMADGITQENHLETGHLEQAVEFCQVFVDRCHHGKEEDILFPLLKNSGHKEDLIRELLEEHERGRTHIKALAGLVARENEAAYPEIVKHLEAYIALLEVHIDKEDNDLYATAEAVLNETDDAELSAEFERIEREKIGEGRHEAFHTMLQKLSEIYS